MSHFKQLLSPLLRRFRTSSSEHKNDDEYSQESSRSSEKETTFRNFAAPMTPLRQNESIGEESEDFTPIFFGDEQLRLCNQI